MKNKAYARAINTVVRDMIRNPNRNAGRHKSKKLTEQCRVDDWPFPTELVKAYREPAGPKYPSDAEESPL